MRPDQASWLLLSVTLSSILSVAATTCPVGHLWRPQPKPEKCWACPEIEGHPVLGQDRIGDSFTDFYCNYHRTKRAHPNNLNPIDKGRDDHFYCYYNERGRIFGASDNSCKKHATRIENCEPVVDKPYHGPYELCCTENCKKVVPETCLHCPYDGGAWVDVDVRPGQYMECTYHGQHTPNGLVGRCTYNAYSGRPMFGLGCGESYAPKEKTCVQQAARKSACAWDCSRCWSCPSARGKAGTIDYPGDWNMPLSSDIGHVHCKYSKIDDPNSVQGPWNVNCRYDRDGKYIPWRPGQSNFYRVPTSSFQCPSQLECSGDDPSLFPRPAEYDWPDREFVPETCFYCSPEDGSGILVDVDISGKQSFKCFYHDNHRRFGTQVHGCSFDRESGRLIDGDCQITTAPLSKKCIDEKNAPPPGPPKKQCPDSCTMGRTCWRCPEIEGSRGDAVLGILKVKGGIELATSKDEKVPLGANKGEARCWGSYFHKDEYFIESKSYECIYSSNTGDRIGPIKAMPYNEIDCPPKLDCVGVDEAAIHTSSNEGDHRKSSYINSVIREAFGDFENLEWNSQGGLQPGAPGLKVEVINPMEELLKEIERYKEEFKHLNYGYLMDGFEEVVDPEVVFGKHDEL